MLNDNVSKVRLLREAGNVARYHTKPRIGTYDVAQHSYGVACLLMVLHPNPSANLLKAALVHDAPERFTGDVPYPAKKLNWKLPKQLRVIEEYVYHQFDLVIELTKEEKKWLKWCDLLEFYLWCGEQIVLGNTTVLPQSQLCWDLLTDEKVDVAVREIVREYKPHATLSDFIQPDAEFHLNDDKKRP